MKLRPSLRDELLTELEERTSIPKPLLSARFTDRQLRALVSMLWDFEEMNEGFRSPLLDVPPEFHGSLERE
jgi:hypothetical protein